MEALRDRIDATHPLTVNAVAESIDIDNMTSWFLAVVFAGTRDAYQGPGQFLDRTRAEGGWFWVNWDMDQSFRDWNLDSYQYLLERVAEGRRGRNPAEPRSVILSQLIAEDPVWVTIQTAPPTSQVKKFNRIEIENQRVSPISIMPAALTAMPLATSSMPLPAAQ